MKSLQAQRLSLACRRCARHQVEVSPPLRRIHRPHESWGRWNEQWIYIPRSANAAQATRWFPIAFSLLNLPKQPRPSASMDHFHVSAEASNWPAADCQMAPSASLRAATRSARNQVAATTLTDGRAACIAGRRTAQASGWCVDLSGRCSAHFALDRARAAGLRRRASAPGKRTDRPASPC